jgi:hypothetical protein
MHKDVVPVVRQATGRGVVTNCKLTAIETTTLGSPQRRVVSLLW